MIIIALHLDIPSDVPTGSSLLGAYGRLRWPLRDRRLETFIFVIVSRAKALKTIGRKKNA